MIRTDVEKRQTTKITNRVRKGACQSTILEGDGLNHSIA